MKNGFIILYIFLFVISAYPVKFLIGDSTSDKTTIELRLDSGVGIEGVVDDNFGIKDFQTVFIRPAFKVNKFGFGLDFKFRFRLYPDMYEFRDSDYYINDTLRMVYLYTDKIDYISYGERDEFIYFKTGLVPFVTAGNGILINNVSNRSFLPTDRENGFYLSVDLNKLKVPLPFSIEIMSPDCADPDMFIAAAKFDILNTSSGINFKIGLSGIVDMNAAESNLLSAFTTSEVERYRNFDYDSGVIGLSLPITFSYRHRFFNIGVTNEIASLITLQSEWHSSVKYGLSDMLKAEIKLINLAGSGFLLGIPVGFAVKYGDIELYQYSSNYQIERKRNYVTTDDPYNFYAAYGLSLYAFQDKLKFNFLMTTPIIASNFTARYKGSVIYDGRENKIFPGIEFAVNYETGMNELNIQGSGGAFLYSVTKDFRFSVDLSYTLFGAKMRLLVGVQSPQWISSMSADFTTYENHNKLIDQDAYGDLLQRFMSLEVSIVL